MSNQATPRRRPTAVFTSPSNAAEIQNAREQERLELQDLNNRVENVFRNYRQRMADPDLQKEQMTLYIKQLLTVYNLLKNKVNDQHGILGEQDEVIKRLGVAKTELQAKLANAEQDIAAAHHAAAALKADGQGIFAELSAAKGEVARAQADASTTASDLAAERALTQRLRADMAALRNVVEDANARAAKAEIQTKDVVDKSARVIQDYKNSIADLTRELEAGGAGEGNAAAVERMHEELWKNVMANAQNQTQLREEMIEALTRQRNDEVAGYRHQLETMGHDLEEYRNRLTAEQNDSRKLLAEYEKCVAAIRNLEGEKKELLQKYRDDVDALKQRLREQAADLGAKHEAEMRRLAAELAAEQAALGDQADAHAAELQKERQAHQAAIAERNEKIRQMKHAFIQKLCEFEELHSPKVSLALQIQTYDSLLAAEEARLGITGFAVGATSPRSAVVRTAGFRSPVSSAAASGAAAAGTPASKGSFLGSLTGFLSRTPAAAAAPASASVSQVVMTDEAAAAVARSLDAELNSSGSAAAAAAESAPVGRSARGKTAAPTPAPAAPAVVEATPAGGRKSRRRTEADALLDDAAEADVQLPPPSARRRTRSQIRADDNENGSAGAGVGTLAAVAEEGAASSLMISGRDALGEYVRILNHSAETVPLSGWALRTTKRKHTLAFPAGASLAPEEAFTVRTSATGEAPAGVAVEDTLWVRADVWDPAGDECLLLNADNEVKARVVVRVAGGAKAGANNACAIM